MKYKIIEILKTFSKQEIRNFDLFLQSPYFNESVKIKNLYNILIKYHPNFDSKNLSEENLYRELNPRLTFNKSTFKSLFFEMSSLAEKFLIIEDTMGNRIACDEGLRNQFMLRKLPKYLKQNIENAEKYLMETTDYADYFLHLSFLSTAKSNHLTTFVPKSNKNFNSQNISFLTESIKTLSIYFLKQLRVHFDELVSRNYGFNISWENNFVGKLFKFINYEKLMEFIISNSGNSSYSAMLELNLSFYRLFADFSNENNYIRSKNMLLKNASLLYPGEIHTEFIRLVTYCKMKLTENNTSINFENELFSIYKYILLKEYYKSAFNVYLPIELFRITLKQGLQLKKYKWTLNFIKEHYKKLNPEWMMNMYYYSMAEYYFHRKKYDQALRNFQKVQLTHFMLKVDIKSLMLMTYYELGLFENALSLIDTYKHFLKNNDLLSDSLIKKLKAFIMTVQKMITYRLSHKPMTKYLIKKNLVNEISNRDWVIEKCDELDEGLKRTA